VAVQGELDQVAEEVRPEDDAGHQLADDAGDVDLLRQPPEDLGGDEDGGELEEHEHDLEHSAVLGDGLELVEVGGDDEGLGGTGSFAEQEEKEGGGREAGHGLHRMTTRSERGGWRPDHPMPARARRRPHP
jgi:hypothetical protein